MSFLRIFPSITSSTMAHFLKPPIEGVVLQVAREEREEDEGGFLSWEPGAGRLGLTINYCLAVSLRMQT